MYSSNPALVFSVTKRFALDLQVKFGNFLPLLYLVSNQFSKLLPLLRLRFDYVFEASSSDFHDLDLFLFTWASDSVSSPCSELMLAGPLPQCYCVLRIEQIGSVFFTFSAFVSFCYVKFERNGLQWLAEFELWCLRKRLCVLFKQENRITLFVMEGIQKYCDYWRNGDWWWFVLVFLRKMFDSGFFLMIEKKLGFVTELCGCNWCWNVCQPPFQWLDSVIYRDKTRVVLKICWTKMSLGWTFVWTLE